MSESLYFGPTPDGHEAHHPFAIAGANRTFTRLRVASAFATESGVEQIEKLVDTATFRMAEKQWLIGLENGLTQPAALRRLLELPNSKVCLVQIHEILKSPGLAASTFFHTKLYEFAAPAAGMTTIITGSANLTEGGLRRNVEQFAIWDGPLSQEVPTALNAWWSKYWKQEWLANSALIDEYAARRPTIQQQSGAQRPTSKGPIPTSGPIIEVEPPASDLRNASELWIEAVRQLEGGAHNQLELMLNAHTFFFPDLEDVPRDVPRRLIFIDDRGREYTNPNRQILYNGPPLRKRGNAMWRVYLPTAHEGLSGYQQGGVLIRFARTSERDRYRLSFVSSDSPVADSWFDQSSKVASVSGPPTRLMGWVN